MSEVLFHLLILIASVVLLGGCATLETADAEPSTPRVELLGFASCPNRPVMDVRLRQALRRLGADITVTHIDQESLAEDDLRRGYAAPTVLVDGRDLFGAPSPESSNLGCRRYEGPDGVPGVHELTRRLSAAGIGERTQNQ